jgi:adenylate cyclase class 2
MKEIEVKILDININLVRKKLKKLGAKLKFKGEMAIQMYDFKDNRLFKKGVHLRLRKLGEKVELCLKGKKEKSKFKIRQETEVMVDNFDNTDSILQSLGLVKVFEFKKHRESYCKGPVKFEIDHWKSVPYFLEIEAPTEKQLEKAVKSLGYSMRDTKNWGGTEVSNYYKKCQK